MKSATHYGSDISRPGAFPTNPQSGRRNRMMNPPRSRNEAIREIRYSICIHELHRRLYKRLGAGCAWITLIASSAVVVQALREVPHAIAGLGFVIAFAGFTEILGRFAERAARHDTWQRQYGELLARSADMTLEAIDGELAKLDTHAEIEIGSLEAVAWNNVLRSNGLATRPERWNERVMRSLA